MGVVDGMTNTMYHSRSGVSSTAVKTVLKSSVAHWKGQRRVETPAFLEGSAIHALLLEEYRNLVIKGPKTKQSKAFTEMEATLEEDQMLLTEAQYNKVQRIAKGALSNPVSKAALRHKERLNEQSIFVQCPRTSLSLQARPDLAILREKTLYDVKSAQDGSPKGFSSAVQTYMYDVQAAFYLYVCKISGWDVDTFKFIAVEKNAPYVCQMHVVSPELLAHATERMYRGLDIIAAAEASQDFGTGWGDCNTLELPKWL